MVYIGKNNISGALKKEFDTLGEKKGMEIKIDESMEETNFHEELLVMMQGLRENAPHVEGQGEGGEEGEHSEDLGMQRLMQFMRSQELLQRPPTHNQGEEEEK